jgi:hypothetical protein
MANVLENTNIKLQTDIPQKDHLSNILEKKIVQTPAHINLQLEALKVILQRDSIYSSKIKEKSKELEHQLHIEKKVLNLKSLIQQATKDLDFNTSSSLLEENIKIKEALGDLKKDDINFSAQNISTLKTEIDDNLSSINSIRDTIFNKIQMDHSDQMQLLSIAKNMSNGIETMVKNQIAR